jgi:hypothetical protein
MADLDATTGTAWPQRIIAGPVGVAAMPFVGLDGLRPAGVLRKWFD